MTKKVKGAIVSIEVTDEGSLKELGLEADKTSKKLNKTGKSTRDVNRNMQAMSGRVESGTKGFARMQQGTGGLVQSYAILASTLFAVGAAFRAFQNAANIENQIKGFRMLGEITGQSMMGVTAAVRGATGGLLNFQDAAQQASIGMAAGFTQEQLAGLAEGAKLASVTLGRDLTDSFNRLIRGVTKAEPELLDELGIILRLDIATRKFANANGLIAEKLTISQRRAAVFEEVQRQLIANFGAMEQEADKLLNPFDRLATKISDFFIQIQGPFVSVFGGIADFISANFGALITVVTMFSISILKQIVPSFQSMGAAAETAGNAAKKKLRTLNADIKTQQGGIKKIEKSFSASEVRKNKIFKAELKRRKISLKAFTAMTIKEQKKLIASIIADEKRGATHTKKMNKQRLMAYQAVDKRLRVISKQTTKTIAAHFKIMGFQIQGVFTRIQIAGQGALMKIGTAARGLAPVFATLGAIMNMAFGVLMAFFTAKFIVDLLPFTKRINASLQAINETNKVLQETMVDLAHTFAGDLAEKRVRQIKEEFEGLEGAVMAANFEMKRLDNILKRGMSGGNFIEDLENSIAQNFGQGQERSAAAHIFAPGRKDRGAAGFESEAYRAQVKGILMQLSTMALQEMEGFKAMGDEAFDKLGFSLFEQIFSASGNMEAFANFKADFEEIMTMKNVQSRQSALQRLLEDTMSRLSDTYDEGNAFLQITEEGNVVITDITRALIGYSEHTINNFKEVTSVITNTEEAAKSLKETISNMMPKPSQAESTISAIDNVLTQFTEIDEASGKRTLKRFDLAIEEEERNVSILQVLKDQLGIKLELTDNAELDATLAAQILEKEMARLEVADLIVDTHKMIAALSKLEMGNLKFLNTRTAKRLQTEQKIFDLRTLMAYNIAKDEVKNLGDLATLGDKVEENRQRGVATQIAVNRELQNQVELLEASLDRIEMLGKSLLETFDKAAASNLATLFETANLGEFGGKELGLGIAKELRKTSAKALAETFVDPVTRALTPERFKRMRDLDPAQKILAVHKQHIEGLGKVLQAHISAMPGASTMNIPEFTPTDPNLMKYGDLFPKLGDDGKLEGGFREAIGGFGTNLKNFIFGQKGRVGYSDFDHAAYLEGRKTDPSFMSGLDDLNEAEKTELFSTGNLEAVQDIPNIFERFFGADGMFAKVGKGIFGKEGLFAKIGKSLFGEDGLLSGMFKGIFGGGEGGGGFIKFLGGLFGGAGAGATGLARGGIMGYSSGGVARQPTYIVGEGKQHEAVVPLPDNRSIPVNLQGAMGNQNNTNITVNIDGTGTQSSVDSQGSKEFADAINGVVQAEIERQMRPGGILAGG